MNALLHAQLPCIHALQTNHPGLLFFYKFFSNICDRNFFIITLPLITWSIDARLGRRMSVFIVIAAIVNTWLNDLVQQPPPLLFDPGIKLQDIATLYSFPSTHATLSVVFWGALSQTYQSMRFRIFSLLMIIAIGLSRIGLGAHFPSDIFTGWALGSIFLLLYFQQDTFSDYFYRLNRTTRLLIAFFVPLAACLYSENIKLCLLFGTLAGFWLGNNLFVEKDLRTLYSWQRWFRFLVGNLVFLSIYINIDHWSIKHYLDIYPLWEFGRYCVLGFIAVTGIPWFFCCMGVVPRPRVQTIN